MTIWCEALNDIDRMIIAGLLQFAPQLGNVEANIARADRILSATENLHDVDLIVCPELAFSGEYRLVLSTVVFYKSAPR